MYTYKKPVPKIAIIPILLRWDTLRFQRGKIGRVNIAKSDTTLKIPLAWYEAK